MGKTRDIVADADTEEFERGYSDFFKNVKPEDGPYSNPGKALLWYSGWKFARGHELALVPPQRRENMSSITFARYYEVPGDSFYTIEDMTMPGEHFFPEQALMRFHIWRAGCEIGWASTMKAAESQIAQHIKKHELQRKENATLVITQATNNIWQLERGMASFRLTEPSKAYPRLELKLGKELP